MAAISPERARAQVRGNLHALDHAGTSFVEMHDNGMGWVDLDQTVAAWGREAAAEAGRQFDPERQAFFVGWSIANLALYESFDTARVPVRHAIEVTARARAHMSAADKGGHGLFAAVFWLAVVVFLWSYTPGMWVITFLAAAAALPAWLVARRYPRGFRQAIPNWTAGVSILALLVTLLCLGMEVAHYA